MPEAHPTPSRTPPPPPPGDRAAAVWLVAAALLGVTLAGWVMLPRPTGWPDPSADPDAAYRVDPNAADSATLQLLPGIGPALADRIIEERTARGPFRSAQDMQRVQGIGPKVAERLSPYVRFDSTPEQGR